MSKQNANLSTLGQIQGDKEKSYLSAPLISVPFSSVLDLMGNARTIRDPSKTLRPVFGIERVHVRSITVSNTEKSATGEPVWLSDDLDERIRGIGNFSPLHSTYGPDPFRCTTPGDGYLEVTFYGTALNLLILADGGARTWQYALDGGSYTTFFSTTLSGTGGARNYGPNILLPVVSNLTLGVHTIKIKTTVGSIEVTGFEFINERTDIGIPQGEIISKGRKEVISSLTSTPYNSGFDGSPVLNGRGGRAVIYAKNGLIGKVLQQTNSSQANYPSADHTNEEIIRRINWREYGANRADDFSTLSGTRAAFFTLDNNTNTLIGTSVLANAASQGLAIAGSNSVTITFIGTGLDIFMTNPGAGTIDTVNVQVDGGGSFGPIPAAGVISGGYGYQKIVSGLPYGTHTVKFSDTGGGAFEWVIYDFIIYGPKKPSVPDGAIEIGEYYLMANYDGTTITGTTTADWAQKPRGTMDKSPFREWRYSGANWTVTAAAATTPFGADFSTTTNNNQPANLTFFGTGIVLYLDGSTATYDVSVQIDGALNASGVARSNASNLGGGSYRSTGTTSQIPVRIEFTGLSLGLHTVTVQRTAGTGNFNFDGGSVICPIHFPNSKVGSLSTHSSAELMATAADLSGIDLSKAKAWIAFDGSSSPSPAIFSSYGIAGFFRTGGGHYTIYLEKPMKYANYCIVATGTRYSTGVGQSNTLAIDTTADSSAPKFDHFDIHSNVSGAAANDGNYNCVVVFGELAEEED